MTQTIRLSAVRIDVAPDLVTTTLPDGEVVYGSPHDTPEYAAHAAERGYGDDVARANRCHEVGHSLLAYWLGLKCSPTLLRVGRGQMEATEVTVAEEQAVLAVERFANAMGVDLESLVACDPQQALRRALACAGEVADLVYQESHERMNGK